MNWLNKQLWNYAESKKLLPMLECGLRAQERPPVFKKSHAGHNIIVAPDADDATRTKIITALPLNKRHQWFRSMKSSQALTQSVFANLIARNELAVLNDLQSDQNLPAFGMDLQRAKAQLEYEVDYLCERQRTSIDVFIHGERRIVVECKLTEDGFGVCSRPKLKPTGNNYSRDFCNGKYEQQCGRTKRCSLSEQGIRYWDYVPEILDWRSDRDLEPCPLRCTYQIARNLIAACVVDRTVNTEQAHALVIYDDRNPAFHCNGGGKRQFDAARRALKNSSLLRSCSWQSVVSWLAKTSSTRGLAMQLQDKYGFCSASI